MKYGFVMPVMYPHEAVDTAVTAEQSGWDAYFLADGMWSCDAWLCLTAAAERTTSIRLGTLLTPLSIMRPWKLAAAAATLDQLSNGRVILTIGMGAIDVGFAEFGEETELHTRAERVDEGLTIINQLWQGAPFLHQGKHYQVDTTSLQINIPPLVQQPRVPIWVVGAWPRPKSMQRVLQCDGIVPVVKPKGEEERAVTPDDVREIKAWFEEQGNTDLDIVIEGQLPGDDPDAAQAIIDSWAKAGATWWIESVWDNPARRANRLLQGPPPFTRSLVPNA